MKVLVTGAGGFVGGHLCRELTRRGVHVRGTIRRSDRALPEGVERAHLAHLDDVRAITSAVEGVSAVVHLAARVHVVRESVAEPLDEYRRVNVEGTRTLVKAAAAAGVRRFLLLSSVKVNGEGGRIAYRESDSPTPLGPYSISKKEAEDCLAESRSDLEWVVLRPPLVYGPHVGGNFLRLITLARLARTVPLPLGGIENMRSFIFVQNLVDGIIHLLAHPGASYRRFMISDGEDISTSDLIRRIGHIGGGPVRLFPCSTTLLRLGLDMLGRGGVAQRLLGSLTVDMTALRETGWAPPASLDAGLETTVHWWLSNRTR